MPQNDEIYKILADMFGNETIYNLSLQFDLNQYFKLRNETENDNYTFHCGGCEGLLQDLSIEYGKTYHVYCSFAVCIFGLIANILNIIVLTRKEMVCAPINRILTALAVTDMLIMLDYMPFSYYYYVEVPGKMNFPYWGAVYMLFHSHFSQILHTSSICLTLTLAIWRYLAIGYPERTKTLCSEKRCTIGILMSYLLSLLLCVPTYLTHKIKATIITEDKDYTLYHIYLSDLTKNYDYLIVNFWLYAVAIKILPCCILTIISLWLIRTLFIAKKRKELLRNYNAQAIPEEMQNFRIKTKSERRANRTTKMLIAVLLLFLMTEFPQGIFALVIGIKGRCFFVNCYQSFGEVLDILALLNGSINFILYCSMNRMFRTTFGQLFRNKVLTKWILGGHSEEVTTSKWTEPTKI